MLGSVREIVKIKKIEILGAKAKSPRKTFSLWTTSNRLLPKLASRSENHHIIIKNAFFRICTETWPQSLQLFFLVFLCYKNKSYDCNQTSIKNFLFKNRVFGMFGEWKIWAENIFFIFSLLQDLWATYLVYLANFKFWSLFSTET